MSTMYVGLGFVIYLSQTITLFVLILYLKLAKVDGLSLR